MAKRTLIHSSRPIIDVFMREPCLWYVLYVRSNTEYKVASSLQKSFVNKGLAYEFETFCPESEKYYKDKHSHTLGSTYRKRPRLPGYVFIELPRQTLFRISHRICGK